MWLGFCFTWMHPISVPDMKDHGTGTGHAADSTWVYFMARRTDVTVWVIICLRCYTCAISNSTWKAHQFAVDFYLQQHRQQVSGPNWRDLAALQIGSLSLRDLNARMLSHNIMAQLRYSSPITFQINTADLGSAHDNQFFTFSFWNGNFYVTSWFSSDHHSWPFRNIPWELDTFCQMPAYVK